MQFKKNILFFVSFLLIVSCKQQDYINLTELQTEHLSAPIGIDNPLPRFTWKITSDTIFTSQRSYQIYVDTDSTTVANHKGKLWNSFQETDSVLITYKGKPLQPFTKYYWGVEITDDKGNKSNLAITHFETGMMGTSNWKGKWITDIEDVNVKPAPYFRKEFHPKKRVIKARAYIAVAGLYELYINGNKIGDHRLDPVYTRFDKRNLYVTYDVTSAFQKSKVALGVLLGNGWYNHQSTAVWNFDKAGWRARPRFCLNVRVYYDDGTTDIIRTNNSWKTALSPVVFNSIYTAEHYDAQLEQYGWNTVDFNDQSWNNSIEVTLPSDKITAQAMPPIRNVEDITPISIKKRSDKQYIFDLGKNISGVTKLKVSGEKGTKLWVTHAEQLDSVGNLDLSNINVHYRPKDSLDPFQTDIYVLNGQGEETFSPKFNYKGFQYVEVKSNKPIDLNQKSIIAEFMHSDVKPIGNIRSSNEIINKIWEATNASYLSNLFGYPTDCPQREKNGWTGDAHINIETGLYNFDAITVYEKWMDDHRDEQQENGVLPSIIPTWGGWGYDWGNGPDWTSTIAIIPWELYQFYGDDKALTKMYEPIKKYVNYITSISYDGGLTNWGLGDWVPVKSETPKELTSSIYYYVDATILAKTAKHFGFTDDFENYSRLAKNIKNAINKKYLNTKTGIYAQGFQTELSAPLYWGVVPDELTQKVADNLAVEVKKSNNHIDVGLLGTKTILGALSQNGYADLAYQIASQETYPSWGWWIKNGATTFYENWDIDASSDISKNHIMFGAISAWFYKALGGILPDEKHPGFKNIILQPHFVNGLTQFEAKHESPYGLIVSNWKKEGNLVHYQCTIPPNSTAFLYLKAKSVTQNNHKIVPTKDQMFKINLTSGNYNFLIEK
ncbi:alpha-L-rhamnosidase [Tenacibaculum adriaticum]|uniref:alpha-L-rhamnosidase n=1 Tax=Tenacibaculum adriaticum TaxID=413713 RepID=A0A5S5E0J1_9FLAO|nr:alpha-L-rhamnosidase [Tenacibaculum adriaticum]TYQ00250.1 alpha-L-rhamnosidase [Tenacibaculum adriaticum]